MLRRSSRRYRPRNLSGIDIAYMDLDPDARSAFTLFIKELADQLHARGKALSLTLPAPVVGPQRIDEAAYDWGELGAAADLIKIAPYRDQSTYRLSMPTILEYLNELVDPAKLILTVTPYAAEKSVDGITTMALADAMGIATRLKWRVTDGEVPVAGEPVEIVGVNIERDEKPHRHPVGPEHGDRRFQLQTRRDEPHRLDRERLQHPVQTGVHQQVRPWRRRDRRLEVRPLPRGHLAGDSCRTWRLASPTLCSRTRRTLPPGGPPMREICPGGDRGHCHLGAAGARDLQGIPHAERRQGSVPKTRFPSSSRTRQKPSD